ncbi:thioredoxin domain-containing protein [Flammeovirgaceae bacterium SG7u.111]|nr:thioredoxin domain-containing protein [Flammeovirgaceae bacterium SG7u.132]WPO34320.1 thioredoxin domain-containing protein [Flammeovirgaceae bacterium SG7u.111]
MDQSQKPNQLVESSSPYLLQHAYNPVEWYPWGEAALEKAKSEDKPIILSIGYSACHWCHVMERESFENEQIATIMNEHFVCIKVDREERPDIDQIYMDAVHAMGLQGGWPLNVMLTPSREPFYGGTYFQPQQWANLLQQIAKAFSEHRPELEESAQKFKAHLNKSDLEKYTQGEGLEGIDLEMLMDSFDGFTEKFDAANGGMEGAPKFPMPSIYSFLLRYYALTGDEKALQHTLFTLDEMAMGGIYDQLGGGFARYSVDAFWFAPHFEKMLYDNAQFLSVYAEAFSITGDPFFEGVIYETVAWLEREMLSPEGAFYSALDADSEGVEGKFYVWDQDEIEKLLGAEAARFIGTYGLEKKGNWEGSNILALHEKPDEELLAKLEVWKEKLLPEREKRIRPGLDDKTLASWNGLILKGLADAYLATKSELCLQLATKNAAFIEEKLLDGAKVFHNYKNGKATIDGFLEDYAAIIQGFLAYYQISFEEKYLKLAKDLTDYTLANFYDEEEKLFFFTDAKSEKLIARKKEIMDNVIPASNSIMATNLHWLGLIFDDVDYTQLSEQMLLQVGKILGSELRYMSNWAALACLKLSAPAEIAIVGEECHVFAQAISERFFPNKIILATTEDSNLPLLKNRTAVDGKTTIYVCENKACQLPVHSVEEALDLLQN